METGAVSSLDCHARKPRGKITKSGPTFYTGENAFVRPYKLIFAAVRVVITVIVTENDFGEEV